MGRTPNTGVTAIPVWFRDAGLTLDYLDHHMGSALPSAYAEVSRTTGVPFLYSGHIHLDSYGEFPPPGTPPGKRRGCSACCGASVPGCTCWSATPASADRNWPP